MTDWTKDSYRFRVPRLPIIVLSQGRGLREDVELGVGFNYAENMMVNVFRFHDSGFGALVAMVHKDIEERAEVRGVQQAADLSQTMKGCERYTIFVLISCASIFVYDLVRCFVSAWGSTVYKV